MITAASFQKSEQIGVSTYRVQLQLTDDVTGISLEWFTVTGTTVADLRDDASRQIAARNALLTTKSALAGIAQGTNIPVVAPAAAAQTPQQAFFANAGRLERMKALVDAGGLDPANAEYVALQASVKAAYLAAYATSF